MFFFVLVAVFLCCYVVKLGIANKERPKNTPKKGGSTSGHVLQDKLWLHVPKLLFFLWLFFFLILVAQKHYKNRVFDDFDMLIFSFFWSKL